MDFPKLAIHIIVSFASNEIAQFLLAIKGRQLSLYGFASVSMSTVSDNTNKPSACLSPDINIYCGT